MSNAHSSPPKLFSRIVEIIFFGVWTAITVLVSYWLGQQSYHWMPPQATFEAQKVDDLFSFLVTLGSAVFLGVFGMIGHSILVCRAEKGDFSEGHPVRSNIKLEVLWTVVPILLVLWIVTRGIHIYSLLDLQGLSTGAHNHSDVQLAAAKTPSESALLASSQSASLWKLAQATSDAVVEVTAKQWAWSFYYPQQNITSAELHLPVNQRARLVLKSADVLHGFYVPAFRLKQDIVPNREIDFVFSPTAEGRYRLQDSQFSGSFFPLMEADVYVESVDDYQQWLAQTVQRPGSGWDFALADLSAEERSHPQNLWGQRWAMQPPSSLPPATALQTLQSKTSQSKTAQSL